MTVNREYRERVLILARIEGRRRRTIITAILVLLCPNSPMLAQIDAGHATKAENSEQAIERLTEAVAQAQEKMQAYQKQLMELQQQLTALRQQMIAEKSAPPASQEPAITATGSTEATPESQATLGEIRERQAIEESQIATHDVSKVETESKYPLKVTGLLLFNGFVNTRQVDVSASPAYAAPGPGSTGLSLRQTVLGLDARGPQWFNAASHADLRVDFFADAAQSNYAASGVLRLRTAHATLDWQNTEAFVELDRSILAPNQPSSLVAVAQPELAWAGNLWNWNPQIGVSHQFAVSDASRIKAQAALIDTYDPQLPGATSISSVTQTERSRWPGTEVRIAFQHGKSGGGPEIGAGGYFSPHRTADGNRFDAWAGTMDMRLPLGKYFEVTTNAYRGQALAGLGAGGYVNYYDLYSGSTEIAHALDDVGGWAQFKARAGQRVEMNVGFGTDNPFANEIHAALLSTNGSSETSSSSYPGLARNRSFFSNVIYSPSAYLLFSLEYKRLWTNYAAGPTYFSDSIGIGAGYKF